MSDFPPPPPPPGGYGYGYGAPEGPPETQPAMWAHLGALLTVTVGSFLTCGIAGFLGWIVPLVILQGVGQRSEFVRRHAKEALNFTLTLLLVSAGFMAAGFAAGTLEGGAASTLLAVLSLAWFVTFLVLMVRGSLAASRGQEYRYPLSIRFVS